MSFVNVWWPAAGWNAGMVSIRRTTAARSTPGANRPTTKRFAFVAVGHALVTSVRRHRRDLALLKTLGFRRRQVRATVAWSATTLAVVGLLVGIPAGVWLGRLAWRAVADGLGVPAVVTVPALALLLTIPAALLFVNVVGLVPARAAARTRPAVALRAE